MNNPITEFPLQPKVIFGAGSYQRLPQEINNFNPRHVLVVADKGIESTDLFKQVLEILQGDGISYSIFDRLQPEAPVECINDAVATIKETGAELMVVIGGGSSIDTAKVAGIIVTNGGVPQDYAGRNKFKSSPVPLIVIPTTAGTGSEMSSNAVITDKVKKLKFSVIHTEYNKARVAILDPLFLQSCPPEVVVAAGVDAFVHAFEAYISLEASPFCEAGAIKAIELISRSIRPFYANRKNLAAAGDMLVGSAMAGSAFASLRSGPGNIHCIARFVGPMFKLSHGLSNAIFLPYVARFNMMAVPEKFAQVARVMGENIHGLSIMQSAEKAVEAIDKMCGDLGTPSSLKAFGCTEGHIQKLAEQSYKIYLERYIHSNPRHTTLKDFEQIIAAAAR